MISCNSVSICGFGSPSSAPPIRRVAKNDKFVLYKWVCNDYQMHSIASRMPVPSGSTIKQCRAEAGGRRNNYSPHNECSFIQQEGRRPKIGHHWQIVFIHASMLIDRHRKLHRIMYLDMVLRLRRRSGRGKDEEVSYD